MLSRLNQKNEEELHDSGIVWKFRGSPKRVVPKADAEVENNKSLRKNDKIINVENLVFSFLFYVDYYWLKELQNAKKNVKNV